MKSKTKFRKIKISDFKYFLRWWRDKELIRLTSGVFNHIPEKTLKESFRRMAKAEKDHHYIILTSKKKVIGHLALSHINKNKTEIQIVIGEKQYWGKSFGRVAIKQAIEASFGKLSYQEIYLEVRPDNLKAIEAYQNCGFKKLGIKKYPKNPNLPKVLMMNVLKDEFDR